MQLKSNKRDTILKLAKLVLILFISLVGAANLAFFVYWFGASEVTAIMPVSPTGYTVEALALNITILEMILVLLGFMLAALGFFGYAEIKDAAISRAVEAAEKEARETVSEQLALLDSAKKGMKEDAPEYDGDYALGDQPVEGATPAEGE